MTSVNAGRSAGTTLGSYLDSLSKTPSGAVSTSGSRQSGGTDGATSDTTSPASMVSRSPRAKAMLAQAKDAQAALKTLNDAAARSGILAKNTTAAKASSSVNGHEKADPAGNIFKLITHDGNTIGFVASGTKAIADNTTESKVNNSAVINRNGTGEASSDIITGLRNLLKECPGAITGESAENGEQFLSALNNGTLTAERPEDVPGLNYKMSIEHTPGGMTMSSSFNMIKPAPGTSYVFGWSQNTGTFYVSWPVPNSDQGKTSAAANPAPAATAAPAPSSKG